MPNAKVVAIKKQREYSASVFSGIVGCSVYRTTDPTKIIAIVPAQFVPHKDGSSHSHGCQCIRNRTQHVANRIAHLLNRFGS